MSDAVQAAIRLMRNALPSGYEFTPAGECVLIRHRKSVRHILAMTLLEAEDPALVVEAAFTHQWC